MNAVFVKKVLIIRISLLIISECVFNVRFTVLESAFAFVLKLCTLNFIIY